MIDLKKIRCKPLLKSHDEFGMENSRTPIANKA